MFLFYRMDAAPRNRLLIRILPEDLLRSLVITSYLFFYKACQAVVLYLLWTKIEQYDKFAICFQALLFIDDVYHRTLDRKNSILMLILIMTSVFMVFHAKSFFGSVFLMAISSTYLKPMDVFLKATIIKSFVDYLFVGRWDNLLKMSSRYTDFSCIIFMAHYHLVTSITYPDYNSVEDFCLFPIFMMHFLVWSLRLYSMIYLCLTTALTVLWMSLKSSKYARIRSALIVPSAVPADEE